MHYLQITYVVADGVLTLTLNRPEQLNAFTRTMLNECIDALDRADAVRAIVVTGAGRGFCAGADLSRAAPIPSPPSGVPARKRTSCVTGAGCSRYVCTRP